MVNLHHCPRNYGWLKNSQQNWWEWSLMNIKELYPPLVLLEVDHSNWWAWFSPINFSRTWADTNLCSRVISRGTLNTWMCKRSIFPPFMWEASFETVKKLQCRVCTVHGQHACLSWLSTQKRRRNSWPSPEVTLIRSEIRTPCYLFTKKNMLHWTFVCTLMIFLVWTREDWQARIIILCFMHLPFWSFSGSYFISISGCWPSSWGGNQPCHPFALHVLLILPQALQGKWLYSLPACFLSKWPQDLFNITLFLPHCQLTTDYASRTLKGGGVY